MTILYGALEGKDDLRISQILNIPHKRIYKRALKISEAIAVINMGGYAFTCVGGRLRTGFEKQKVTMPKKQVKITTGISDETLDKIADKVAEKMIKKLIEKVS